MWKVSDIRALAALAHGAGARCVCDNTVATPVGQSPFEVVITGEGREQAGKKAQQLAQRILDSYNSGIKIERLSLQRSYSPQEVAEAFRDVVRAGADAQSTVNEATAYSNQVTQQALGQASQIKNQAEGYRSEKVAIASGETQRFNQIYEQYKQNPDVTSRRLYLETLEQIMGNMNKVLIDTSQGGSGAVPYLPLDQLLRQQPAPAPTQPPAAATPVPSASSGTSTTSTGSTN